MKLTKFLILILSAVGLVVAFQNCGQPGSVGGNNADQVAKLTEAASEDDTKTLAETEVVAEEDSTNLCEEIATATIIKEVKAPSASDASSHLFTHDQNISLALGVNKILLTAKDSARKLDKFDLIMADKLNGKKVRIFLNRSDYTVTQGKTYEFTFKLSTSMGGALVQKMAGTSNKGKAPTKSSDSESASKSESESESELELKEQETEHNSDGEKMDCRIEIQGATLVEVVK